MIYEYGSKINDYYYMKHKDRLCPVIILIKYFFLNFLGNLCKNILVEIMLYYFKETVHCTLVYAN